MLKAIWHSPEELTMEGGEHSSLAISELLEELTHAEGAKVLDLGRACQPNLEFLNRFCRRVYIEDLFQNVPDSAYEAFPVNEPPALSFTLRPLKDSERFNVILCWDLLNYMEPRAIRELSGRLRKVCAEDALLFALVARGPRMFTRPNRYRIVSEGRVAYAPSSPALRPAPQLTKAELGKLLPGFESYHSYRLRNGMDEELFIAC